MSINIWGNRAEVNSRQWGSLVACCFALFRASVLFSLGLFVLLPASRGDNFGFENGDFTDWAVSVPVVKAYEFNGSHTYTLAAGETAVETNFLSPTTFTPNRIPVSYLPVEGNYLAALGTSTGQLSLGFIDPNNDYNVTLRQTISLGAGDTVSGWSAFFNGDYKAQDKAWVKIYDLSTGQEVVKLWSGVSGFTGDADGQSLALGFGSPWTAWNWMSPVDSSYVLELGIASGGDDMFESDALFDGIQITRAYGGPSPVPDAGTTIGLLGMSLLGLGALRRKLAA